MFITKPKILHSKFIKPQSARQTELYNLLCKSSTINYITGRDILNKLNIIIVGFVIQVRYIYIYKKWFFYGNLKFPQIPKFVTLPLFLILILINTLGHFL